MSTLVKLCFASLMASCMIPGTSLASPSPSSQQTTPAPSADADKQTNAPAKPHQPRPNPDAAGKYHVGDGVTAPRLVHSEEPNIPKNMRKANIPGSCLVALTVDTNGIPTDIHIVRSTPDPSDKEMHDVAMDLQNFCIEAAQKYRFQPATFQGKPAPVDQKVEISYQKKF
jgi:outer membrane biosynthesis protein TonB